MVAIFLDFLGIGSLFGQNLLFGSNSTATSDVLIRILKFTKSKISKWKVWLWWLWCLETLEKSMYCKKIEWIKAKNYFMSH